MGNRSLFPVVAVPRAFFGTFFRFERKYFPPRGGSPTVRAAVGASVPIGKRRPAPAGAPKGFPRGKQSARFALPCAPLVVCLNSGSLTAFGGCIHWMTVNFSNLNLKSSVCQRQTGLPKGNPPCAFPAVPAGVLGRREGAGIQWMQLPKAVSD